MSLQLSWLHCGSNKLKAMDSRPTRYTHGFWVMEVRGHDLSPISCTTKSLEIYVFLQGKICRELRVVPMTGEEVVIVSLPSLTGTGSRQ